VIVVATEDFELYHDAVSALRDRGAAFTTVEPGADLPEEATVVLVGEADTVEVPPEVAVVEGTADRARAAVEEVIASLRGESGRTVVGIDPGEQPGIAVLDGEMIVATFQVPPEQVPAVVREQTADAPDPLVRIGDGARLIGARIVDELDAVPVELVDESGTTPYLGSGARGIGDILAAVNIARIEGEPIESREIEPTAGEIKRIQEHSREQSAGNRTIDGELARQVALGELTIGEALDRHRE
jgi:hypothetical protein